jgi:hypothetical protein
MIPLAFLRREDPLIFDGLDPRIRWDYSKVDATFGNPGLPKILIG